MTQDMNHTFVKALRAVFVATMMSLAGSHALAQGSGTGVHVMGNVYGGGNLAPVGGNVEVNMKAGTVEKDVYGGGALANTNINNVTSGYGTSSETISSTSTNTTTVNLTGGTIKGDAYGGGLGRIGVTGSEAVYYTQLEADAYNAEHNLTSGDEGFVTTETIKTPAVDAVEEVKATVYGDVNVNLGSSESGSSATAFWIANYGESTIVKSGRVFGCNNLNGSPLGNVTVTVYKTVEGNSERSENPSKNSTDATYEVAAVYGGGNLANYTATGKKTHVVINGCNDTSIQYVYGGGNAAAVPETDVDINAAYEIGYVFGGGNGKDQYTLDGGTTWNTNPGANVNGNASTMLYGGVIHEAFGGSNEKGTISGTVSIDSQSGDSQSANYCALSLGKLYGAGKNADIEGDLIVTLGCMPGDENPTDEVYGGAENANVKGNVELTITSGTFHKVFGGNNTSGAIFGHIKLNIEETGCCPIKIDELYLGGYNAPYSVYGYYQDGNIEGTDKPKYVARQSASDHVAVSFTGKPNTVPPYDDPKLNIISCTRIGKVFGGGLGSGAVIYGNPTVNINQIYGIKSDGNGGYTAKATTLGAIGGQYILEGETVDGGVFGGGNQAKVEGNTTVNIGTLTEVDPVTTPVGQSVNTNSLYDVVGANIVGNVYGGGNLADVADKTNVNICAEYNTTSEKWDGVTLGTAGVSIAGNVYGGGKGVARESGEGAFFCAEAMVGEEGTNSATNNISSTYADYGTHVRIGNGTVGTLENGVLMEGTGNVYGGGEIGRVEFHTDVTIGFGGGTGSDTKSPVIYGSVFGAGKGTNTHGYSGLVRGDSKVAIQGDAKVGHSVYGGGEMASVGKYDVVNGLPKTPVFGGKCTVTIQGYAEIGPNNMQMTKTGGPDDTGHVFGAGKGILPYENVIGTPWSMQPTGKVTYDNSYVVGEDGLNFEAAYYKFIQSLGLASNSDVTIGGHAFVKGSVYGGSENGYLQANTHVTIAGGQVGAGQNQTAPYNNDNFIDPSTTQVTTDNALATCATWTYDKVTTGKPYDKYAAHLNSTDNEYYYDAEFTKSSKGGAPVATDGHTYYGNVFGGGRGVVPFAAGKWHRAAGSVAGNTQVDITAGHILSSVYGGNENTDVGSYALGTDGEPTTTLSSGGTCTINITGGTVGVPRTKEQIEDNPVIGNVFGAGKGDKRVLFNTWTNVGATSVNISGDAIIYGSVFGGGEDGHVIGNAVSIIGGTVTTGVVGNTTEHAYSKVVIGSTGISGADGNVFGGGRGSETALTAGVVGGNVNLTIDNGNILGSVYGGGRLASVGTNFVNPENTSLYGALQTPAADHGNTVVTINGGTIGASDNSSGKLLASDYSNGDVFGGSMGMASNFDLGIARSTTINMTGGTAYGSIYGGGELAQVVESHTTEGKAWGTEITISGGTIGVEKDKLPVNISSYGAKYGNVYGGGKGNTANVEAGLIKTNTKISISQAESKTTTIYHNIYGGGAYGSVGTITYGDATYVPNQAAAVSNMPTAWERAAEGTTQVNTGTAEVYVYGGTIGTNGNENGMVFGSSRGDVGTPVNGIDPNNRLAWVYNTKVEIGGEGKSPIIKGSVYGSGENGHVFTDTQVDVHNGTIGVTADDSFGGPNYRLRGNVYGGGCGEDTYPNTVGTTYEHFNPLAGIVLGTTKVTIDGGQVVHNVYGAGALGSATNTSVTIAGDAVIGVSGKDGGNVFGAARGKEGITIVGSNLANSIGTEVNINGGQIWGSVYGGGETGNVKQDVSVSMTDGVVAKDVYGGGALAHTQTANWDTTNDTWATGKIGTDGKTVYKTTVNLLGGEIHGDAYGGGLGRISVVAEEAVYYTAEEAASYNTEHGLSLGDEGFVTTETIKTPAVDAVEEVKATVYGDVNVNLGSESGSFATSFMTSYYTGDHANVVKSGRIFGCNNLMGSPRGNVTVDVWKTVAGKDGSGDPIERTPEAKKKLQEGDDGYVSHTYEVAAVYGGGNLADYEAEGTGKKAHVVIETCEVSIETVYGGGNAAEVPGTDVLVKGAYEINEVFGGGNGKDPYTTDGGTSWTLNGGANIGNSTNPGNANTLMTGGLIHAAYGGSNEKGTIYGDVQIDVGPGDDDPNHCTLDVEKMVGAGKNADVNGNLIMILGCKPSAKIPVLYAGADQANVNGNVELTITSGNYGEVFGGNNLSGAIRGHIKLNIEETGDCETPITIDNLYLGGNQAAYSVYGYYVKTKTDVVDRKKILKGDPNDPEEIAVMSANGKLIFLPRESASDPHLPVKSYSFNESLDKWEWEVYDGTEGNTFTPYVQPKLNITSCTYIGNVFGGGYGTGAKLYGNPTVNINMIQGSHADDVHTFMAADDRLAGLSLPSTDNPNNLGVIGNVYGGGNAADVVGNPTVNIGTASTVDLVSTGATGVSVVGAYIIYNVYGGGKGSEDTFLCEKAMIGVDGAGARDADGDGKLDTEGGTTVNIYKGLVRGNVYGGGQIGRVEKNTVVTIGDGTNDGAGTENGTPTPVIRGSVFGGGKGEKEHGYAALVRGNPTVTIQGNAKVLHSVYGGGEIASVARYNVPKTEAQVQAAIAAGYKEAKLGMPYALKDPNSGTCTVIVRGYAEIGPDGMQMTKTGGPDDTGYVFGAGKGILPGGDYEFELGTTRRMVLYDAGVHTTVGQEGSKWQWVDPDHSDTNKNVWEYFATLDEYIAFIQTLALSSRTYVTITDNAFVKGSVYGGSENGIVQFDTDVKIQSGQIGCGEGETGAHPDAYWTSNSEDPTKFAECASWLFKDPYAPYDPYAKYKKTLNGKDRYYYNEDCTEAYYAEGGAVNASDGHTFYGNVFGGGSGSVPYFDHTLRRSVYLHSAGQVKGNTNVTISGGHILTNVYGGCEATNVGETANVTMTGGTIGVPRTDDQIIAHPLTGYLFGGGKGDQRIFFNKDTNVKDAVVKVEGGRIYGSVYGGGEDGHVLRNVTLTIGKQTTTTGENNETVTTTSGPKIGTKGTSYYDGHVFGGGRGFGGDALTAGNVGGSVDVNILDGDILGSVYGGGRLASVGYGLYLVDEEVTIDGETVKPYGTMRPDDVYDDPSKPTSTEDAEDFFTKGRGHINITISGGTIGNGDEYAYDANNQLSHTKGGNVFAGGMGRLFKLDNTTPISSLDWWKLGNVKSTKLTISGNAKIKSCVYGGGELGMVQGGNHTSADSKTVSTEIIINGGTIGTEVTEKVNNVDVTQYTFGSVFGGGYGSLTEKLDHSGSTNPTYSTYKYTYPKYIAGRVKGSTEVTMTSGAVKASVYGGGEMAAVGESKVLSTSTTSTDPVVLGETLTGNNGAPIVANTYVTISGGTIGKEKVGTTYFGGAKMGNVYGGGSGHNNTVRSGHIYGNTNVTITGESTHIYHNVYGGGAYGTVGDFTYTTRTESGVQKVSGITGLHTERTNTGTANVTITGGIIGYDGKENGMVFGSSRGDINQPGERDDYTAWVYDANVTIGTAATPAQGNEGEEGYVPATDASGPEIKGSVYGSGENGHTFNNTVVTVNGGTIGIASTGAAYNIVVPDPDFPNDRTKDKTYSGAAYPYRGNVYGGGCGTDKYYSDHALETHDGNGQLFNPLAGIVYGTTTVNIKGGTVVRNVYGAGAMGSVGKVVSTTTNNVTTTTTTGGLTTIKISGGTIGVSGTVGDGNVFGAARGDVDATINESALVRKETTVFITDGIVKGNVYGGGELGCVGTFTISDDMRNFYWTDSPNADIDPAVPSTFPYNDTGICNVTVDGSSAVIDGNVFGAGKGKDDTFWCEKGIAYSTSVNIKNGTVNGNVYGGGEVGRVETDTEVKVGNGEGTAGGASVPIITGSVFGGGAGVETHGYSALVRGNTKVTVEGNAGVGHNVYGGGEIASVGRYALDSNKMPSILQGGGYCYVTVQGRATIGDDVFGAGKGITPHFDKTNSDVTKRSRRMTLKSDWQTRVGDDRFDWDYLQDVPTYSKYLETLALATHPEVTIDGNASISGSVFGGGELGLTKGSVIVNIQGGTITDDVYGGGSLANTNTTNSVDTNGDGVADKTVDPTTTVNLKGGIINRNVYGGGLGQLAKDAEPEVLYTADDEEVIAGTKEVDDVKTPAVAAVDPVEAKVNGDVLVKLNEPTTSEGTPTYGNCVVKGIIFGCNNLNGSPQKNVTVHVYKTVGYGEGHQKKYKNEVVNGQTQVVPDKDNTSFDLKAVYGGGNVATYCPDDPAARATATANVIIDGCDLTSIETVYGGGNAAAAPATHIEVNSCYEIGTVFGGGNGKDALDDGSENPGADVGYKINSEGTGKESYGTGVALAELRGGTIHKAFGGSNTKGNVRTSATVDLNEPDPNDCPLRIEEVYGAGNEADQDGSSNIDLGCISYLSEIYGGAKNADVNNDIVLTIQSGRFDRVFGGNNLGGNISGTITVNIEEMGCHPIVIGQLFGGGNQAAYTAPWKDKNNHSMGRKDGPTVNVKSFTSIGEIYGGGYGNTARVTGDTYVNINECKGKYADRTATEDFTDEDGNAVIENDVRVKVSENTGKWIHFVAGKNQDNSDKISTVWQPEHRQGAIGTIGNVFGGGNEAGVVGNTNINIGDKEYEYVQIADNIVAGETDVRDYYTRLGEGTQQSPYEYTEVNGNTSVTAEDGTTYYQFNNDTETYTEIDGIDVGVTDVSNYYIRSGEGTQQSPYVYSKVPIKAHTGVTYYKKEKVLGVNITGNVYGGGNAADVSGDTNVFIGQ